MKIPLHNILEKATGLSEVSTSEEFDAKIAELEETNKKYGIDYDTADKVPQYLKFDFEDTAIRTEPDKTKGWKEYFKYYKDGVSPTEEKLKDPKNLSHGDMDSERGGIHITREEYQAI